MGQLCKLGETVCGHQNCTSIARPCLQALSGVKNNLGEWVIQFEEVHFKLSILQARIDEAEGVETPSQMEGDLNETCQGDTCREEHYLPT